MPLAELHIFVATCCTVQISDLSLQWSADVRLVAGTGALLPAVLRRAARRHPGPAGPAAAGSAAGSRLPRPPSPRARGAGPAVAGVPAARARAVAEARRRPAELRPGRREIRAAGAARAYGRGCGGGGGGGGPLLTSSDPASARSGSCCRTGKRQVQNFVLDSP
jgi:hypothetical protein